MLANAGPGGQVYPDFRPFTMQELRQHLGLYILQGLNPSPRVEMKFKSDASDSVHGSNLCFNAFGPNAERRHRHFKCFFGVQDPLIQAPPQKKDPNWKARPLFKWMNYLMPLAWLVGRVFSTDEQTMGFQGHHADKKRITYKDEGDGFQGDALCQDGWTHQIFMRNDPAPKEFLRLGLSPLHSRVLWLFSCLKADYHVCGVDNLYTSAKFCRVSYVKAKVLLNGVTRTGSRGLPKSVLQDAKVRRLEILAARGTVKAAVLIGDAECPNLVAASVYDTKPVHFLSTVCENIKWIQKERLVFNAETGKTEMIKFLRLEMNDFYNNSMGHVDLSDQLRNQYRFDHWLRMQKWWWALFWWWIGVMMVNAYVYYVSLNLLAGKAKKNLLSHHDFRRAIALSWIAPDKYSPEVLALLTRKDPPAMSSSTKKRRNNPTNRVSTTRRNKTKKARSAQPAEEIETEEDHCARRAVLDDRSLAVGGSMSLRLHAAVTHWPAPTKPRTRCQMHRWLGIEAKNEVMHCKTCNVALCIFCYERFHTYPQLTKIKEDLKKTYREEWEGIKQTGAHNKK